MSTDTLNDVIRQEYASRYGEGWGEVFDECFRVCMPSEHFLSLWREGSRPGTSFLTRDEWAFLDAVLSAPNTDPAEALLTLYEGLEVMRSTRTALAGLGAPLPRKRRR